MMLMAKQTIPTPSSIAPVEQRISSSPAPSPSFDRMRTLNRTPFRPQVRRMGPPGSSNEEVGIVTDADVIELMASTNNPDVRSCVNLTPRA